MAAHTPLSFFASRTVVDRLRRSERNFTASLARRRAELDAAGALHWTDPVHLQLSATLRNIRRELSRAEASLQSRRPL